jgi:hypothetical protein
VLSGALLLLALAGCDQQANAQAAARWASPSPSHSPQPAAMAGGACQLLDFAVIGAELGVQFDIAAASTADSTAFTCVVQRQAAELPDLSLAVTPTQATATVFKNSVLPKGGTVVSGLGKVGYSVSVAPGAGAGPGLEIGWLSGNQRLIILRYQSAPKTPAGTVNALRTKMIELAKKIDITSV